MHHFMSFIITNRHNNQPPVGLLAQLVEPCTGIAEVMGSIPEFFFFRPYFHYSVSSSKVALTFISSAAVRLPEK